MSRTEKMVEDLVDLIVTKPEKYKKFKSFAEAIKSVDYIIDNLDNEIDHVPAQIDAEEQVGQIKDELGKDEAQKQMEEAINNLLGENEYQDYFRSQLEKWGVKSPAELPPEKKSEFFSSVSKGWKNQKPVEEYVVMGNMQALVHAGAVIGLSAYAIKQRVNYCKEKYQKNKKDNDGYKECLWGWFAKKKKANKEKKK